MASFVNPARVPRRSGAEEVCATAQTVAGVDQVGPVLNRRGYERLAATACTEARMTDVLDRPLPGQLLRAGGFGAPAPS